MKEYDFEKIVIKSLISNESVRNKVLPFLKDEWFGFDIENKIIVQKIIDYNTKFSAMPNVLELKRMVTEESTLKALEEIVSINDEEVQTEYILQEIEEFVRRKLLYNAANDMHEHCAGKKHEGSFADIVADAETFSFDTNIGLSFFEEPQVLFEDIITHEKVYPSGVKAIDDMIGGGFHEKSLNLIMAPTNIGKTLMLCSFTTNLILAGHPVLYITFEDSEKKIAQRIAQNLYDVTQEQLKSMTREAYGSRFTKALTKIGHNKLVIREYAEGSMNALGLKALIKELKDKKDFVPEALVIDYIGCMIPNGRISINTNDNTKLLLVSGQVRSIGMELGIPVISASQTNRGGYQSADIGLDDVADSFGQTMKADAVFGVMQSPELKEAEMYSVKLLKTRYGNKRGQAITIGVDIEKQRIFDLIGYKNESSSQDVMDMTTNKAVDDVVNDFA